MAYIKNDWEEYRKMLVKFGYTEEQIQDVFDVRETYDNCPYEQFRELFLQGVIQRVAKVRKPRNYYVNDDGEFLYLNHRNFRYEVAARFKTEE